MSLRTARIAGIRLLKKHRNLNPLCHPLLLSKVEVQLEAKPETNQVRIESVAVNWREKPGKKWKR